MLTPDVIPQEWKDMLGRVQKLFPGAKIAGGCLRDLDHGKPIKDVDIFIPTNPDDYPDLSNNIFKILGENFGAVNQTYDDNYPDWSDDVDDTVNRALYAIYQINDNGVTYELIFANPSACHIATFDLSICQIEYDDTRSYVWSCLAYDETKRTGIITVENTNRLDRQEARMKRILQKYPEYNDGGIFEPKQLTLFD